MSNGFGRGMLAGIAICVGFASFVGGAQLFKNYLVSKTVKEDSVISDDEFKDKFNCIENYIDTYFLNAENVDKEAVCDGIYQGLVDSLDDKYADYYSAEEYASFMESSQGQYGGIGAYVSENSNTGAIVIVNPFEGGPADIAGIKPGDIIVEIDGVSVAGKDLNEVVTMMKGEEDTTVDVKLARGEESIDLTITRKIVDVPTVTHEMIEGEDIGYIYLSAFDSITPKQFNEAIDDLESKGAKGLIIDVRDNGGGLLVAVVEMLDRILPEGLVMYTETKDGRDEEFFSTAEVSYDKPMVVLINEYSASASEVFAGAVQDYKKATIVGTTSYGKGVVQTVFPLRQVNDGSAIKLTTSKYFTPNGRNIDGIGITPDVEVKYDKEKTIETEELLIDNQLQKAIDIMNEQIK